MSKLSDWNEVRVSGRLTHNPEVRKTPSGVAVCDMSIACNRYSRPDANGDQKQYTTFIRATAWNKQAEFIGKTAKVGDEVIVIGVLEDDNFTPDGEEKATSGRLKLRIDDFRVGRVAKVKTATDLE